MRNKEYEKEEKGERGNDRMREKNRESGCEKSNTGKVEREKR